MLQQAQRPDVCGVVRISGVENAVQQVFPAMYAPQHRGPEAGGIVAFDGEGGPALRPGQITEDVFGLQ